MAINFLNSVDFNQNELLNPRIENQANDTAAGTGVEGQLYFNTTDDILKVYAGGSWVEVGGGVTSLTTTDGTFIDLTPNSATTGAVTVTADLSATGTPDATKYLRGDNAWEPISAIPGTYTFEVEGDGGVARQVNSNDTLELLGGTYITSASTASPGVTFNHDSTSRTDTTSTDAPAFGGTFTAVQSVTTNATGHVTAIDVSTVTLPTPAASDNYQYWTLSDGTNSTNITSTGTATFQGTANEVEVAESSGTVTVGLPDDVTITGELTVSGTGQSSFGGQVTVPATPVADTDAASKGYVLEQVSGVGSFQGGYNANTNSPALTGASNVAVGQGDFYVVTVDGSFFTENVEVGDFIFANSDIAANSNPSLSDYTVVIADQNIAGEGATDGATEKGVAGFNSAFFSVTANGFVSADYATSSAAGVNYIAAGTGLTATYGASGRITISKDNSNQSAKRLSLNSSVNGITRAEAGGVTTFTLDVTDSNLFGSGADPLDVMCEVLGNAVNAGDTVYASIERSGINLLVKFTGSVANADYQILLNYVA